MINKRYLLGKKLGEGRSKVFSVIDTEFPEREAAVKFLPYSVSEEEKVSFRQEYFTLQKLDHPQIIKSFELGTVLVKDEEDSEIEIGSSFITLEHFPSSELLDYTGLDNEANLSEIIKQICSVLYYLHQSNYIYYDLKTENILVADIGGKPIIKIIDLGLSQYILKEYDSGIKGSTYYIAPELLKKENHDHTVDFYSLGMLLYRIVYGRFPFKSDSELDIYKAHIEEEFPLPESSYSKKITDIIAKLIKKNPADRYENALQIIKDLNFKIDLDVKKDFIPAKIFSDRKDAVNIIQSYLNDNKSNEIFSVKGFDGSGKTALLKEIYYKNPFSIFIENTKTKTGIDAVKYIFRKILFSDILFNEVSDKYDKIVSDLFENDKANIVDTLKNIFNNLPEGIELLIAIDDFNLYDSFTIEVLLEVFPILQINQFKIIISESSVYNYASTLISNLCDIQLNQFTDHQLSEYIDLSYSLLFPKRELKKFIQLYSDLLPGSIKQFIKDIIILDVMKFDPAGITFKANEDVGLALQSSHEEVYRLRLSNLSVTELNLAQIISAFEISVEQTVLSSLIDVPNEELKRVLSSLEKKNIIEALNISNAPQINSISFKKYIYSTISNKIKFHVVLANSIKRLFPDFNTVELSRQFELANEYERAAEVLRKEINRAEDISAYSYKKSLLERLLKFTLPAALTNELLSNQIQTVYKLSDYKSALEYIENLNLDTCSKEERNEILFIKGSSLIGLRKIEEGKKTLDELRKTINDKKFEQKILVELAYAEFDLGNSEVAEEICTSLQNDVNLISFEVHGKILNLLASIEYFVRNNYQKSLEISLKALDNYRKANLLRRMAGMYVNIGSVYYSLNEPNQAEKYWTEAIDLNRNIGNLEQESYILLNYGVFYQDNSIFEKAIENWTRSKNIFSTLGDMNGKALTFNNLGEVYLQTSDYQNSYDNLTKALLIFRDLNNKEEESNTLYLLGKFWFNVGDKEELKKIIDQYENHFANEDNITEKAQLNFTLLKLMRTALADEFEYDQLKSSNLLKKCSELGETNLFIEIIMFLVESLIDSEDYENALKLLNDKELIKAVDKKVLFIAQREYLLGKIAVVIKDENLKSPIDYFEYAYSLIENQSISELTWKILYGLADAFWERGNFHKAKKPRLYAIELLEMISEHIIDNKIRAAYKARKDRKQALEKLKLMSNTAQINEFQKS